MAVNEAQLQTWTNAPSSTRHQLTHNQIREALAKSPVLRGLNYEVYLQGSYANSTNTRSDSDVDIVVQLNSTYSPDTSRLSAPDLQTQQAYFIRADYLWANFRQDVLNALTSHFGLLAVKSGPKCIKVAGNDTRVPADVLPCIQHRQYRTFTVANQDDFVEGVKFWTADAVGTQREVINYPKIHIENGEHKNSDDRTGGKYKHLVRIVKNIRRQLVDRHGLDRKRAPSYFIECAIYNVPDEHFQGDYQTSVAAVLDHILNRCNAPSLQTASHQHILFGNEPWQWNQPDAAAFFQAAHQYYLTN